MRSLIIYFRAGILGFNPWTWFCNTRQMRRLVRAFAIKRQLKGDALRFAVVLVPWMGTSVPWFSLIFGLYLSASGNKVTFIMEDLPFGNHVLRFRFLVGCIRSVLKSLSGNPDVILLSTRVTNTPLTIEGQQSVNRLARLNAVWALRGEIMATNRQRYIDKVIPQLSVAYGAIGNILQAENFDSIFIPGGIWGTTGIWVEHARASGVRVASFDALGNGLGLMLAVDGIACQSSDIPRAFSLLKIHAESSAEQKFIVESALLEMMQRRLGIDKFASQIQNPPKKELRFSGAVLIALNSSWDSAALGLHDVYESSADWIIQTIRHLLDKTSVTVVVRQHPAERLEIARTTDDYRSLLKLHFGSNSRLHFIAAEEQINTYDLLEQVVAVVVHTSTIGIEAVALGRAVVTSSRPYYSEIGFIQKATSMVQYHQYLSDAASGRHIVTPAMRKDALYCYYLTQCCNMILSKLNPENFEKWSYLPLDHLLRLREVQMIVKALEQNLPIAYLNHLSKFELQLTQK